MNMTSIAVATWLLMAGQASAAESPLSVDRIVTEANGRPHVIRRSEWSDFNGGAVQVEQRLRPDGSGRLIYRYAEQTEATKIYHQAFCEALDMEPSPGEGIIDGPATGWACSSVPLDDQEAAARPPQRADWVTTAGPSGRVPVVPGSQHLLI